MTLPKTVCLVAADLLFCSRSRATSPRQRLSSQPARGNRLSRSQEKSDEDEGLRFRLSEGTDQPEVRPATNLAPATSLSNAETEAVLKRLPPIKSETSDETDFALRRAVIAATTHRHHCHAAISRRERNGSS